jgi:hypothetical protein
MESPLNGLRKNLLHRKHPTVNMNFVLIGHAPKYTTQRMSSLMLHFILTKLPLVSELLPNLCNQYKDPIKVP